MELIVDPSKGECCFQYYSFGDNSYCGITNKECWLDAFENNFLPHNCPLLTNTITVTLKNQSIEARIHKFIDVNNLAVLEWDDSKDMILIACDWQVFISYDKLTDELTYDCEYDDVIVTEVLVI